MQQLPEHIANAFARENGFYTAYAIVKDNTKRRENLFEDNLKILKSIKISRFGAFYLHDKELEYIDFTTDKGSEHHMLINGEDSGLSYEEFSTMMANSPEVLNDFCQNISNIEINEISFMEFKRYLRDLKQFYMQRAS